MARKLFISFLGTNFYHECYYTDGGWESNKTRYVQQATLERLVALNEAPDAVRIFITQQAFIDNWNKDNGKRENKFTKQTEQYVRLGRILDSMNLQSDVKAIVDMPVGNDQEEMWEIFQRVYDEIENGDELYIDLTHAFRYLPMLVLVLSNYAKFLKHVSIKWLSYGNWEGRDIQTNRAPIVNLLPLTKLQDWTLAASEYLKYGYTSKLTENIMDILKPLLKNEETRTEDVNNVREFAKCLTDYAAERLVCRGLDIEEGKTAMSLSTVLNKIENTGIVPLNPVFEKIKKSMEEHSPSANLCLKAAEWCYKRNLFQQAATLLREGVITFFCKRHSIDTSSIIERELVSKAIEIRYGHKENNKELWKIKDEYMQKVQELLDDGLLTNDMVISFISMRDVRNDYNHAGFRPGAMSYKKITQKIGSSIKTFNNLLGEQTETWKHPVKEKIFLNVSNHPIAGWDEDQIEAAKVFGKLKDYPFPSVCAVASTDDIYRLACETARDILCEYPDADITAHVMGEMTFTFALVTKLKALGIRCVASCTDRVAENLGNGDKLSHFHFAQIREY